MTLIRVNFHYWLSLSVSLLSKFEICNFEYFLFFSFHLYLLRFLKLLRLRILLKYFKTRFLLSSFQTLYSPFFIRKMRFVELLMFSAPPMLYSYVLGHINKIFFSFTHTASKPLSSFSHNLKIHEKN